MGEYVLVLNTTDKNLHNFVSKRIVDSGQTVSQFDHPENTGHAAFIIGTPKELIRKEAEGWGFLKRGEKGYKREYLDAQHDLFEPPYTSQGKVKSLFSPSEVSYITHELLKRVKINEVPDFFPRSKSGVHPSDSMILALERVEMVKCWPLHCSVEERGVAWQMGPLKRSSCDHIEHYFGSNVALYFAWLTNYIMWLIMPAVAGFAVFVYHYVHPDINVDNSLVSPIYTFFIIIWGVLFVNSWDRKCASHVCDWGINQVKWRQEVRSGYVGRKRMSPVTGMPERYFDPKERLFRYCVSACVTLFMLILAFSVMVISLNLQGYIHKFSYSKNYLLYPTISWLCDEGQYLDPTGKGPMPFILLYIPVIFHVVIIQVLNKIYQVVAINLTNWENHRSPTQHENALYVKRFFFEAFDCYIALFYLAFIENDIVLLRRELVSLYTVDSIRRLATETIIPHLTRKVTRAISKEEENTNCNERIGKDYDKDQYEQFDDYLEMIIQIGYVTLFAGAFPLAAPLSIICNVLELYSDVFKLTYITRRPIVHRITNIGVWSLLVKGIVLLSVFTNLYIFCFTSEQLMTLAPSLFEVIPLEAEEALKSGSDHVHVIADGAGMIVATVMMSLEHVILFMVAVIWITAPDTTPSVDDEMARREYSKFLATHGTGSVGGISLMSMDNTTLKDLTTTDEETATEDARLKSS